MRGRTAIALGVALVLGAGRAPALTSSDDRSAQISRVERGLPTVAVEGQPAVELTLPEWLEALGIPGLSLAVIDDFEIVWARGYGVLEAGGDAPVTPKTLFQAASIAKPVTALAVLRQVERGTLELDADIDDYLTSWKLGGRPASRPTVTLRHLLSHTAGITGGGFAGYAVGAPLPDLAQILDGRPPAENSPARLDGVPGSEVRYSGLGYTMIQLALVDRLARPFTEIMADEVLRPLKLDDSTFEQPLPASLASRAARGHRVTGARIDGGWALHPEQAAAGLWTTPTDLATLAIDVARARAGEAGRLLTPSTARRMLTPEKEQMGLGWVVGGTAETGSFSHSGGNQGYRCRMEMNAETGQGVVIMTNSDAGSLLLGPLTESVARAYDWPSSEERGVSDRLARSILDQIEQMKSPRVAVDVDPAVWARYAGRYELAPGLLFDVTVGDGRLEVRLGDQPRFPVYPESPTKFFFEVTHAQITFEVSESGEVTGLTLHQGGRDQRAPKIE